MQVLQTTQEKNASGSAPNATSTMASKAGVTGKRTGKKQRNKQAKIEKVKNGPKRPLNSWMAFRSKFPTRIASSFTNWDRLLQRLPRSEHAEDHLEGADEDVARRPVRSQVVSNPSSTFPPPWLERC